MAQLKALIARIKIFRQEMRGAEIIILRLLMSFISLLFSLIGLITILLGWSKTGLILLALAVISSSITSVIASVKIIKIMMPIKRK